MKKINICCGLNLNTSYHFFTPLKHDIESQGGVFDVVTNYMDYGFHFKYGSDHVAENLFRYKGKFYEVFKDGDDFDIIEIKKSEFYKEKN